MIKTLIDKTNKHYLKGKIYLISSKLSFKIFFE